MRSSEESGRYSRAEDDNLSFRRGLVLGLTLAEIGVLIIFIVLLAFGARFAATRSEIARLERELQQQHAAEDLLRTLADGSDSGTPPLDMAKALIAASVRDDEFKRMRQERDDALARLAAMKDIFDRAGTGRDGRPLSEDVIAALDKERGRWPPFFNLSEAGGYYFDSGKATLRPDFEHNLRSKIIPMLVQSVSGYDVDVVEVIGHTDEVPMSGVSNLDGRLIGAAAGRYGIGDLRSTDNAGLAMARAVAVARILRSDPRLANVAILPLSGAQMIVPVDRMADGSASASDQRRRRIEIRLRRSTAEAGPQVTR